MSEVLKPCPCGHAGKLDGRSNGVIYTLTCPACGREASTFLKESLIAAWNNEQLPANPPKVKRVPCENRNVFESDHPGPFERALDAQGNEQDEYAAPRTQEDWLLWLRAQAAIQTNEQARDQRHAS